MTQPNSKLREKLYKILTKEFTKEQKDSLLEHYDWYYDYMNDTYISPNDNEDYTHYTIDEAFEMLKEELKEKLKKNKI